MIKIGTTKVCNINPPCVQCPKHVIHEFGYLNNDTHHINKDYLRRIAPFLKSTQFVSLHGFDELLTCSYLLEPLEYCDKKVYKYFCTNGLLLMI